MSGPASAEDYARWLEGCRDRLGRPPRKVGVFASWFHLWLAPPPRLPFAWDLAQLFYRRRELLRDGPVVWGHLVDGDAELTRPGLNRGFVTAVFGSDPANEPTLPHLRSVAAALTGTLVLDPGRCGEPVPAAVAGRHACAVSPVWVDRRHLPDRQLVSAYFPLLVLPDEPRAGMILPARYWPADLVEQWLQPPL